MAVLKITNSAIISLKPGKTIWDANLKGFGVRKQRQAAVYVFKYRDRDGRQRFHTIGRHGAPWTLNSAKTEAQQYQLSLSKRPCPESDADSGPSPTLREFAQIYLKRYAALHKKLRSLAEDERNLSAHILPVLGHKDLAAITAEDIADFHTDRRKYPANANRCLALISHIFTIATRWGAIRSGVNPCRGIRRYREAARERFLTREELQRLGRILDTGAQTGGEDWRAASIFKLLIYTGARLNEILTLQWGWIHWESGFARLPVSKTGSKNLPLPQPALALLQKIAEANGRDGKYVFPGKQKNSYFTGIQKPWQRVRDKADLSDVRIHDLRHCYASVAVAGGESLYLVGHILGHRSSATTQRYAHLAMTPILESANRTAARLADFLES